MSNLVEVYGVGSCNLDHVLLVERFPEPDEKIDASEYILTSGGVIGNYLAAVSRLGTSAGFLGAFGDDEAGKILLKDLKKDKIDTSLVKIKKGLKSPETFILVASDGEKVIIQSPFLIKTRVNVQNDLDQDSLNKIAKARLIHTSHIHGEVTDIVVKKARAINPDILVSFDLEKQVITRYGSETILDFIDLVDILVPQKMGIMKLLNMDNPIDAARRIMKKKPNLKATAVTLGEDGCRVLHRKDAEVKEIAVPGFKVKPVDVTGAGDAFNAAFDVGYLKGWDMEKTALFANGAGALNCLKVGARSGMVTMEEVIEFVKYRGLTSLSLTL